jgi:hypothetical protein
MTYKFETDVGFYAAIGVNGIEMEDEDITIIDGAYSAVITFDFKISRSGHVKVNVKDIEDPTGHFADMRVAPLIYQYIKEQRAKLDL